MRMNFRTSVRDDCSTNPDETFLIDHNKARPLDDERENGWMTLLAHYACTHTKPKILNELKRGIALKVNGKTEMIILKNIKKNELLPKHYPCLLCLASLRP